MRSTSFFLALTLFLLPAAAVADYADTDYGEEWPDPDSEGQDLLDEDFFPDFPPVGWTVVTTNPDATWQQSQGSCDAGGNTCAMVDSVGSDGANELLVSPPLVCPGCNVVELGFDSWDRIGEGADYDSLTAQISYDFGTAETPGWTDVWPTFTVTPDTTFWIGFRYTGADCLGWEIDNVRAVGITPQSGDDDQGSGGGGNDDDDNCGCRVSRSETSIALTLVMLTIGLAAFVFSQRAGSSRKRGS